MTEQIRTALIRRKQVEARTGLARSTIYDLVKRRQFPAPLKLTEAQHASAWLSSEVDAWVEARIKASGRAVARAP